MLDMKFLSEKRYIVKENIKKKFQDYKLPLVNEVLMEDKELRQTQQHADDLRANRKKISKEIGKLMGQGKKEEAEEIKQQMAEIAHELTALEEKEIKLRESVTEKMMQIPNIIDDSVPIGKDDSENVELEKFGEPVVPDFEIPYHTEIMERLSGIDLDAARRVAGNGFYYLMGDVARLHSAILNYARDFMIDKKGFTYVIPPYMIRSSVVDGVMSFAEMEGMMYKIEGEDLYLIGTSEHSLIGKFKDTILEEGRSLYEVYDLQMGKCRMCVCGPESAREKLQHHELIRVASKYPNIAKDYFNNIKHQTVEIIKLNGSVELAPIVGLAEVIVDIVETGATLRENGLEVLEEVCPLSARMVVNQVSMKMEQERINKLINDVKKYIETQGI